MSTAGPFSSRRIIETDTYKDSLAKSLSLPGIDKTAADEVMAGVGWSLQTNPYAWPRFPNTERLYVAKTHRRTTTIGYVPQLRVLYSIDLDGDVTLLQADTMDVYL